MLNHDQIMPIVKGVAKSVTSKFPPYVHEDDALGALLLWVYQNRSTMERIIEDGPGWEAKISPMLRKVAFDHCNSEKAAAEGYDTSDIYRYSTTKIESLIADAMDYENWQSFSTFGDSQPRAATQVYNERVTELIDVKDALTKVTPETYSLLVYRYSHGYTFDEVAEALDTTAEAARKRVYRALKALQKALGYKETPTHSRAGRRPVRTNAAWRAELSTSYEG